MLNIESEFAGITVYPNDVNFIHLRERRALNFNSEIGAPSFVEDKEPFFVIVFVPSSRNQALLRDMPYSFLLSLLPSYFRICCLDMRSIKWWNDTIELVVTL